MIDGLTHECRKSSIFDDDAIEILLHVYHRADDYVGPSSTNAAIVVTFSTRNGR